MPPLAIAAGIGAAASIGGAALSSHAANKAANKAAAAQTQAAQINADLYKDIYSQNKTLLAPYVDLGVPAGQKLSGLIGQGPFGSTITSQVPGSALNPGSFDDFKNSTNYNWALNEGLRGVNTAKWAGGSLHSGDTLKSLIGYAGNKAADTYGQYISQLGDYLKYNDAFNIGERAYSTDQYNTNVGNLFNLLNTGAGAASATAGVGTNFANQTASANNQAANAQQQAALLSGINKSNMYSNIGGTLANLLGGIKFGGGGGGLPNVLGM
ncbi:MAG TPA: hypothetical protein VJ859_02950 [Allosphingosinicella sp.]|nr:hypothetical protein [Allosphingosinicella sp.]